MRDVDIGALLRKIVLRLNKRHEGVGPSLQLVLPRDLPILTRHDENLEPAIEKIIHQGSVTGRPSRAVKITVRQKSHWQDLEDFFGMHPSCWIQLSIELGAWGFGEQVCRILQDHGYERGESVEVENCGRRLDVFYLATDRAIMLLLWMEEHRFDSKCALLIPLVGFSRTAKDPDNP